MKQASIRKQQRPSSLTLMFIGAGLILLGVAAFLLLPGQPSTAAANANTLVVPAAVEYPAPELALTDLQGNPVSLEGERGQVLLVNLWATWCPPCKAEMPTLQAYHDEHAAEGFKVVAINDGDPTADVVQFVKDYRLSFPVWLDPAYIATEKAFQTVGLPSSFVIDRQGTVRLRWVGEISAKMLDQYVTPIITE